MRLRNISVSYSRGKETKKQTELFPDWWSVADWLKGEEVAHHTVTIYGWKYVDAIIVDGKDG